MALIKCPECGRDISDSAIACPNCGYDVKSFITKKKKEEQLQKARDDAKRKAEETQAQLNRIKEKLFGNLKKKIAWGIGFAALIISLVSYTAYNSDLTTCKSHAKEAYNYYEEVHGNLMSCKTIGNSQLYDIHDSTMWLYNNSYNKTVEAYNKLNSNKQSNFSSWFKNEYHISFDDFKTNCLEDNLGQPSDYDWEAYLSEYRLKTSQEQREAKLKEVEVVNKNLVADGNYYDFTATLKNNTSSTITYIKYTVFIYDQNGKNIDSDWSNWSGTLRPGATINVDTMIKKYSNDTVRYSVVIDEYK